MLVTTVDISPGVSVQLSVFPGDDPGSVAEAFCAAHGLVESVVGPLTEHIEENLREEAAGVGVGGGDPSPGDVEVDVVRMVGEALERKRTSTQDMGKANDGETTGDQNGDQNGDHEHQGSRPVSGSQELMNRANEAVAEVAAALESLGLGERYLNAINNSGKTSGVRPAAMSSSLAAEFYGTAQLPTTLQRTEEEERVQAAERLYADHFRKERMLEEQRRIQDLEDQLKMQQAHCTEASRAMAAHRTAEGYASYGERLYKEGVEDAQKREALRLQAHAEQVEREMADVTFHPQISKLAQSLKARAKERTEEATKMTAHQRLYHANATAEAKRLARHEAIRREQEELEMKECSFHPQLSKKSERMMERRRLATTGSGAASNGLQTYDRLHYQGAHQKANWEVKKELMALPEEATFRPEINQASIKRAARFNKDGPADVAERLLIRGQVYQERLEQTRAELSVDIDPVTGQKLFHPVVSKRVPKNRTASKGLSDDANASGIAVGEHLYQEALESAKRIQESREETYRQVDSDASKTHVNAVSHRMMERLKRERIQAVFAYLARTPVDCMPPESIDIVAVVSNERFMDTIDPEVRADVELAAKIAMQRVLMEDGDNHETNTETVCYVTEAEFVECMYEVISRTRGYTRTYLLPMPGTRVKWEEPTFKPELSEKSLRLAARSRPANMPNHEILYNTAGDTAAKIEQLKREMEKREMELCTFKPRLESSMETRPMHGRALRDAEVVKVAEVLGDTGPSLGKVVQRRIQPSIKSSMFHVDVQASSYADNSVDALDSPDAQVESQMESQATISASVGVDVPSKRRSNIYDGIDAIENEIKEAIAQLSVARDAARPKVLVDRVEEALPDFVDRKMAVSLPEGGRNGSPCFDVHAEF